MPELLTRRDRSGIESLLRIGEDVHLGTIAIDTEACSGCGLCVPACAGRAIEMVEKKAALVRDLPLCMACGDCAAICPDDAIDVTAFMRFSRFFKYLDRGRAEWPRTF